MFRRWVVVNPAGLRDVVFKPSFNVVCRRNRALLTGPFIRYRFLSNDSRVSDLNQDNVNQKPPATALPPSRRLIIVTCMDSRINPFDQLDIKEGEAHIIRNAGGIAKDALRSIVISQRLLGTREIAVYHHTGCGMVTFTTSKLRNIVKEANPGNIEAAKQVDAIDFLEFEDLEESVRSDVKFLKNSPLLLKETKITGWIYDVDTRQATQVV